MLKIGDFSRIAHVTIKTLRHYAKQGLLEPVWIDRFSGYRYYTLDQLPRLNRVLALKDLGFSLDQIKHALSDDLSASELRGMLRLKQTELRIQLKEEQRRLERVEKRLKQIEIEGSTTGHDVLIKPLPSKLAAQATMRAATIEQVDAAREGLQKTILNWCEFNRIKIEGPWFSVQRNESYVDSNIEIHLGVFVEENFNMKDRIPDCPVRLTVYQAIPQAACLLGNAENPIPQTELIQWIETNGYSPCGETRLVYLGETPDIPLTQRMLEIQTPVLCDTGKKEQTLENKENKMEPVKFETLPAFKVMGLKYRGKNENQEIAAMWGEFNKIADQIPCIGECAFGICQMISDAPQGVFEYVAGFKVADDAEPLEGMVVVNVPENRYAVFEHRGPLEALGKTYGEIINGWFPRSGMKPTGGYDMEVYDEKFTNFSPDSVFYIYEPVK